MKKICSANSNCKKAKVAILTSEKNRHQDSIVREKYFIMIKMASSERYTNPNIMYVYYYILNDRASKYMKATVEITKERNRQIHNHSCRF